MEHTEITWDQLVRLCRRAIAIVTDEGERLHTVSPKVSGEDTIALEMLESEEPYCLLLRQHNCRMTWAGASVWVTPHNGGGTVQMTLYRSADIAKELKK